MHSGPDDLPTAEAIAVCARLIWEQEGRPEGRALQHWLQAETQLLAAHRHEQWTRPQNAQRATEQPEEPSS